MLHRLWFRLRDVAPLAAHARACTTHLVTEAQQRAAMPLRPALIWTGSASHDRLESNGLPGWFRDDGDPHTAIASTWQHVATGRRGTVNVPAYRTAYMPLVLGDEQLSLADAIRIAHNDQQHWMTVDINPADAHTISHLRIGFSAHRTELVPAGTGWTAAAVTCDAVAGARYPALIADGYTTDAGHLLPRFDHATVDDLILDLDAIHDNPDRSRDPDRSSPAPGGYPILRMLDRGILAVYEEHHDGTSTSVTEVDQVRPDTDGRYSLGAHRWPWHHAG